MSESTSNSSHTSYASYTDAARDIEDVIATDAEGLDEYLRLAASTDESLGQWREYAESKSSHAPRSKSGLPEDFADRLERAVHEPLRISKYGVALSPENAGLSAEELYRLAYQRIFEQATTLKAMCRAWLGDDATKRIDTADAIRFLTWQTRDANIEALYLEGIIGHHRAKEIRHSINGEKDRKSSDEKRPPKPKSYFSKKELEDPTAVYRELALLQDRDPGDVRRSVSSLMRGGSDLETALLAQYADYAPKGDMVGIDLETTGTSPASDAIIDAGWERYDLATGQASAAQRYHYGLAPERAKLGLESDIVKLTGLTAEDLQGYTPFQENVRGQQTMMRALDGQIMVAHNANFERGFLLGNLTGFGEALHRGSVRILDSMKVAQHSDPVRDDTFKLDAYARRNGALGEDRDTAVAGVDGGLIRLDQGEVERHLGLEDAHLMMQAMRAQTLAVFRG